MLKYGMSEEDIMNLTPKKLSTRLTDIFEAHAHLEGPKEKQGRVVKEPMKSLQDRIANKDIRPPTFER